MRTHYDSGYDDGRANLFDPGGRTGDDLLEYLCGHREGIEAMKKRNQLDPVGVAVKSAGAIQHAVTVTRPDPSRAEIAMRFMERAIAAGDTTRYTSADLADSAVCYADALIAALEKAKP
jgi:hypothetical protein